MCKTMGWDYHVYNSQPPWFLEEIALIMFQEAQASSRRQNSAQAKSALRKNPRARLRR